jgi:hypothetical protein
VPEGFGELSVITVTILPLVSDVRNRGKRRREHPLFDADNTLMCVNNIRQSDTTLTKVRRRRESRISFTNPDFHYIFQRSSSRCCLNDRACFGA